MIPNDILQEVVPGSVRTAEHFLSFLRRFCEYLQYRMRTKTVLIESPAAFLRDIQEKMYIERRPLRYCDIVIIFFSYIFPQLKLGF